MQNKSACDRKTYSPYSQWCIAGGGQDWGGLDDVGNTLIVSVLNNLDNILVTECTHYKLL